MPIINNTNDAETVRCITDMNDSIQNLIDRVVSLEQPKALKTERFIVGELRQQVADKDAAIVQLAKESLEWERRYDAAEASSDGWYRRLLEEQAITLKQADTIGGFKAERDEWERRFTALQKDMDGTVRTHHARTEEMEQIIEDDIEERNGLRKLLSDARDAVLKLKVENYKLRKEKNG